MKRLLKWWQSVQEYFDFYVPAEVDESLPKSLPEYRARKEALLKKLRQAEQRGIGA